MGESGTLFGYPLRENPALDDEASGPDIIFGDFTMLADDRLLDWPTGTPVFQERDGRTYMIEPKWWPERILIAEDLLRDGRTDIMDFSSFRHLRIRVANGQAIYRLVWRSWRRTFAGELVYGELA